MARRRLDVRAWGAFHGLGLVGEHAWGGRVKLPGWLRWLVTFHLIVFGWVLFRAQSLSDVGTFFSRLFHRARDPVDGARARGDRRRDRAAALPPRPLERLQVRIERLRPALLGVGAGGRDRVRRRPRSPSQGVPPFIYFRF